MSVDVFSLSCGALSEAKLVAFKGTEHISRPYEIDVFFTLPSGTDVRGAVGSTATVSADRGGESQALRWHGVFARVRMLRTVAERTLYRGTLVPRLWRLCHSFRSSVFTKKKIKDFLTDTLKDAGLAESDVRFHIDESRYPEEEFVAQYRETHLDFFHRWLEREGLYYFFEHEPEEGGKEIIVVVDDKGQHGPLSGDGRVRYFPAGGDVSSGEHLSEVECDYQALPAGVVMTDYNYANPAAPVLGEHAVSQTGQGRIRDYGHRVFDEGEATRLAEVKAQAIGCRELTLRAVGNVIGLRAGYTLDIDDLGAEELPSGYLAYEVRHAGAVSGATEDVSAYTGLRGDETYRVELSGIPKDVQYRAPQSTHWPRIYGFENAVVDGPADSPYAQIDDQGRYLVKFFFDASDLSDGVASTYIRMSQPHGGGTEGFHFPLRKGTEVMVAFSGGDPDRPLISGVVPDAQHPSPVTSGNHTLNVVRTGGNSHLEVEDLEGKQHMQLYTPTALTQVFLGGPMSANFYTYKNQSDAFHDFTFFVGTTGNAGFSIGGEWWEDVGATKNVHVVGAVTIGYDSTSKIEVGGNTEEYYNANMTTWVKGTTTQTWHGAHEIYSQNTRLDDVIGNLTLVRHANVSDRIHGGLTQEVTTAVEETYHATLSTTVAGTILIKSKGGDITVQSPTAIKINAPSVTIDGADVKTKGSSWWKGFTPLAVEVFGSKNAMGVQKLDIVGLKLERTNIKIGVTNVKMDAALLKADEGALGIKSRKLNMDNWAAKIGKGAARVLTVGFSKI